MSLVSVINTTHENYMKWLVSGVPETHNPEALFLAYSLSEAKRSKPSDFVLITSLRGYNPSRGAVTKGTHEMYTGPGMIFPLQQAEDVEYQLSTDGSMINVNFRIGGIQGVIYTPSMPDGLNYGSIAVGKECSSLIPVNFVRDKR